MLKIKSLLLLSLLSFQICYAQEEKTIQDNRIRPFIAYEFGEAAFNDFQSISGEIGVRLKNNQMIRLTHMNVNLTEQHLSSSFAGADDGNEVEGKLFGFEAFYDLLILVKGLYVSPSMGYYKNEYNHTVLNENLKNNSLTLGMGISYRERDVFRIRGLYYMVSLPFRIHLNSKEETKLGDTTIKNNAFDNNIWLFIGYEF